MNPKYKAELKKSACEAVEMNRKEPGADTPMRLAF